MSPAPKTAAIIAAHRAGTRTTSGLVAATGAAPSHVYRVCRENNLPLSKAAAGTQAAAELAASFERIDRSPEHRVAGLAGMPVDMLRRLGGLATVPQPLTGVAHNGYDAGHGHRGCGDKSLADEPSNRQTWATGNPDEPYITATTTYFIIGTRDSDPYPGGLDLSDHPDVVADIAAWDAGDQEGIAPERIRYLVNGVTEWVAHTDLDDPGSSAVRSESVDYDPVFYDGYDTPEEAEEAARNAARNEPWQDYHPENWN